MNEQQLLKELGFSEYEARAYVSMVGAGSLNGYEVAKAAGMPRANVYGVLEKLVERGAAHRIEMPRGKRYTAVRPAELTRKLERRHQRVLGQAREALSALEADDESAPVFNLASHDELLAQARTAIDNTQKTLLIGIQPAEAGSMATPLREARERGVTIITLCMEACSVECGGCQGHIHRYNMRDAAEPRWLLIVGDEQHAVAGEIRPAGTSAIATEHPLIVRLVGAYVRQSLALATLGNELGDKFEGLLSLSARQILDELQPKGDFLSRLSEVAGK